MTEFPHPKLVSVNGVSIAVYESNGDPQRKRPPIILVHGWPEIAYSWKNQIPALKAAGFRVIALDLKGFGGSDAPRDKALYHVRAMTDDFLGVLDALAIDQAIFCGHDWGGALVWPMAQLHPERVAGVIGVCTPHLSPPPVEPLTIIEQRYTDRHYFIQFQENNVPEELFSGGEEKFFKLMFRAPAPKSEWEKHIPRIYDLPGRFSNGPAPDMTDVILSQEDLDVYVEAYRRSGFHGGINLYRNIDNNYHFIKDVDPVITKPALWVGANDDMFLPVESADEMEKLVPDLEKKIVYECGHWIMWEQPNALNELIVDWLSRRFP